MSSRGGRVDSGGPGIGARRSDVLRFPISVRTRSSRIVRLGVRQVLAITLEAEEAPPDTSIGLLFCGDVAMRRLNREFRGKDRTTDVLSFPDGGEPEETGSSTDAGLFDAGISAVIEPGVGPFLGDIAVSLPQCIRQAAQQGVDPGVELVRLLVHGVLHLLGYDHIEASDRRRMVSRERCSRDRIRRRGLGPGLLREIPNP